MLKKSEVNALISAALQAGVGSNTDLSLETVISIVLIQNARLQTIEKALIKAGLGPDLVTFGVSVGLSEDFNWGGESNLIN